MNKVVRFFLAAGLGITACGAPHNEPGPTPPPSIVGDWDLFCLEIHRPYSGGPTTSYMHASNCPPKGQYHSTYRADGTMSMTLRYGPNNAPGPFTAQGTYAVSGPTLIADLAQDGASRPDTSRLVLSADELVLHRSYDAGWSSVYTYHRAHPPLPVRPRWLVKTP
ncbi:hypothetical protein GCM10027511_24470 [Hymenobacter humi]